MRRVLFFLLIVCISGMMISCNTAAEDSGEAVVTLGKYKGITYDGNLTEDEQKIQIMKKVVENASFNRDLSGEIEQFMKEQQDSTEKLAKEHYQMSATELLASAYGMSEKEYKEYSYENASNCVKQQYVLAAIVEKEGITLSQEEYIDTATEYINKLNFNSIEEFEKAAGGKSIVEESLLYMKAQDFIFDMAVVID